jgi:hypothetical protein
MYPQAGQRERLCLIIGEIHHTHHTKSIGPAEHPQWLVIPERGALHRHRRVRSHRLGQDKLLYGSLRRADPLASSFGHRVPRRRLVLEVKGDFCFKVKKLLDACGRGEDYVEVSLHSEYRYNPLRNDQDAYALAFGIASLLNNLFGRGKVPFWQQAYTNLVKFIILLHKVLYDYATLFDAYACAINPQLLQRKIEEGDARFEGEYILIDVDVFEADPKLDTYGFQHDQELKQMKTPFTEDPERYLRANNVSFESQSESGAATMFEPIRDERKKQQFEAVKRWFFEDWQRIEPKLRTPIVEGISVFLSLVYDSPDVKRVFCPPEKTYDPKLNRNGRYGSPMPPFSELIEQGRVVALNLPVAMNPGLAKTRRHADETGFSAGDAQPHPQD